CEIDCDIDRKIEEYIELVLNDCKGSSDQNLKTLSSKQAVEQIFIGAQNINLSVFKSKDQKLELLDYATLTGDKYTLTKVIIFLEQTLKSTIFFYELFRRPIASNHYLSHLRSTEKFDQYLNFLNRMGHYEDAAFFIYIRALKSTQDKIKMLRKSLINFSSGSPELTQWQSYLNEQIILLEKQFPIETDDQRRAQEAIKQSDSMEKNSLDQSDFETDQLFLIYPRPCILDFSLMETLRYSCLYHYNLPDNHFVSPFHLKKIFNISEKQFLWQALQSLSKTARWTQIDNLFEYKSWLGNRKIRNIIPIGDIVEVLHQNFCPPEMIEKYLDLVDDIEYRLQLAKDFQMLKYAADILIKQRDRKRLIELKSRIKSPTDYVQHYIDNALIVSTIKWKN
ncbi:spermatogenesis-defective protein 39-like protein, partial [Sarcoptes scabiei]